MRLEGRSLRRPERESPCAEGAAQLTGSSEELRSPGPSEFAVFALRAATGFVRSADSSKLGLHSLTYL